MNLKYKTVNTSKNIYRTVAIFWGLLFVAHFISMLIGVNSLLHYKFVVFDHIMSYLWIYIVLLCFVTFIFGVCLSIIQSFKNKGVCEEMIYWSTYMFFISFLWVFIGC